MRKSLPIFPFREGLIEAVREYQARHWPVGSHLPRVPGTALARWFPLTAIAASPFLVSQPLPRTPSFPLPKLTRSLRKACADRSNVRIAVLCFAALRS